MSQHLIHILFRNASVRSAIEQNAILPILIHLDDRMAGFARYALNIVCIDSAFLAGLKQDVSFFPYHSGMIDVNSGLCKGNGLVQPLASAEGVHPRRCQRLSRRHHMVNRIHIVQIQ